MTGEPKTPKVPPVLPPIAPDRLVYLTDGIYAIALTLTAVQIQIPTVEPDALFAAEMLQLQAALLSYALSFYVLARLWVGHLGRFRHIELADPTFIWLSLISLGLVALVPAATSFSNAFPTHPVAVVAYLLLVSCLTITDWFAYRYALARGLAIEPHDSKLTKWKQKERLIIPAIAILCALLAIRQPAIALPAFAVLIILAEVVIVMIHRTKQRREIGDQQ